MNKSITTIIMMTLVFALAIHNVGAEESRIVNAIDIYGTIEGNATYYYNSVDHPNKWGFGTMVDVPETPTTNQLPDFIYSGYTRITWEPQTPAPRWNIILVETAAGAKDIQYRAVPGNDMTADFITEMGKTYYYSVASCDAGCSPFAPMKVFGDATKPDIDAPEINDHEDVDKETKTKISWNKSAVPTLGYFVRIGETTDRDVIDTFVFSNQVLESPEFTVKDGKKYTIMVASCDGRKCSPWSKIKSFKAK